MRRTTIGSVIALITRHRGSRPSRPAQAPRSCIANLSPAIFKPTAPIALAMNTTHSPILMPVQFTPSPLVDDRFAGRDDVAAAYRDPRVQSAAHRLAAKIDDLRFIIGYHSAAAMGIRSVLAETEGRAISAEDVALRLCVFCEQVDEHIVFAREHVAEHYVADRACLERHRPLRTAVTARLSELAAERDRLVHEAARRHDLNGGGSRYATLSQAGLSDAQIEVTEPAALSPQILAERRQVRLAEITPIIEKLQAFGSSPDFNASHLDGLPEFDALVAARDGGKAVA